MGDRVLVVEDRRPIGAALRAHLEVAGLEPDVVSEKDALDALRPEHAFAIVRAARRDLEKALRERESDLLVVALFDDDDAALAGAADEPADAILVGPLLGPVVAATARAMVRLRAESRRAPERAPAQPAGVPDAAADLAFYRRILLMEVKRARRYRYPLALAVVAIDRWGELAPQLGAPGRARLAGQVLATLARSVRDVDLPLLHTRERFLVVMPHTGGDGALLVARRLCDRLKKLDAEVAITASAGVSTFDGKGTVSLSALLAEASKGLEAARRSGGGKAELGTGARRPDRAGSAEA